MPAVYEYMAGYTKIIPRELRLALMVNRYGTTAVFGNREIPAKDILAMNAANNVYNAWQAKENCRDEKGRYSSGLFHRRCPIEEKLLYQLEHNRRKSNG